MSESFNPQNVPAEKPEHPETMGEFTPQSENPQPVADRGGESLIDSAPTPAPTPAPAPAPVAGPVVGQNMGAPAAQETTPAVQSENPTYTPPAAQPVPAQFPEGAAVPASSFVSPSPQTMPPVPPTMAGNSAAGLPFPAAPQYQSAPAPAQGMPAAMPGVPEGVDPVVPVVPPVNAGAPMGAAPVGGAPVGGAPMGAAPMPTPPSAQQGNAPYGASPYGSAPYNNAQMPGARPSQGLAVASLILGILALLTTWIPVIGVIGVLLAVVGLGLSAVALFGKRGGKGFAIGGLVTSLLALIIGFFVVFATIIATIQTVNEVEALGTELPSSETSSDLGENKNLDPVVAELEDMLAKPLLDEIKNNPDAIKFGTRTQEMPASFDSNKNAVDVEVVRGGGIPTEEGSWDQPAKSGRWAVGKQAEVTVRKVNLDASSEVTDPTRLARLDGTNKYISVEYEYKNYTDEDDKVVYLAAYLIDPQGKIYYHAFGPNGSYNLIDEEEAKAGTTLQGKGYYLVPANFDGRIMVDMGNMGLLDDSKRPPSVYFYEMK